ncbi:MAG: GntR family transcriptional regulator [Candidatus Eremiobacteraeota bacterium]|nr:GntR family transcriptional regulator [Candidatus Eremiobacteraeota bacterium]
MQAAGESAAGRGASIGRAYDELRALIVHGRLAPGSRIVESEIAERLQVSRTPVRSALHRLRQEGYVTAVDRAKEQRLIVAPLTQEDGRELFYIVGQIETLAARIAAELPPPSRTALVRQLRQLNRELAQAARAPKPDPLRIFDLDTAFHRAYVDAAAGARLLALHDAIKPQAERYARLYTNALLDEIATSVEEHAAAIQQIEAGNPAGAQQAIETNWRNAAARLAKVIGTLGERGTW